MKVFSVCLGLLNRILAASMLLQLGIIFLGKGCAHAQISSDEGLK